MEIKIENDIDNEDGREFIAIIFKDVSLKNLKNIYHLLKSIEKIYLGINKDAIIILSSENLISLKRIEKKPKFSALYSSQLGEFYLHLENFEEEYSKNENTPIIKVERKDGDSDEEDEED
ncbi:MAG: hypothetical protein ACP5L4_02050 [Thermoplasmata archaeon]